MTRADDPLPVTFLRELTLDITAHPRGVPHLSAASGMVLLGGQVIVAADDEHHIGIFDIDGKMPGRLLRVLADNLPQDMLARKKRKPDTEALLSLPSSEKFPAGALLAMGSGSRANRQTGLLIPLGILDAAHDDGQGKAPIAHIDLAPLYAPLREYFADLNIEGAFVCGDEFVLLQRGNAGASPNASIRYGLPAMMDWLTARDAASPLACTSICQHTLGSIDGVPLCFTDGAALRDGSWLFSAVAENTDDSYADGVCSGTVIGVMRAGDSGRKMWRLPAGLKVEGVAVEGVQAGHVDVLMTTDADDPLRAAQLLRVRISLS